ncbi:MAG: hypothetical protein D6798_09125, partial [Deltaproteobacteria bacterium]
MDRPTGQPAVHRPVLLALDSYGGTMTATQACHLAADRLAHHRVPTRAHPMSDGGEGLLDCLAAHRPLRRQPVPTTDPLGRPRTAALAWDGEVAVVESAEAVGLHHVHRRRPLDATSAGLGPLLEAAAGARRVVVGLGGSATVDGGLGMLQALGLRAEDRRGRPLVGAPARELGRVARLVGPPPALPPGTTLADVVTPIAAAAATFGPQKGLGPAEIAPLTEALRRWAEVLCAYAARQGINLDPALLLLQSSEITLGKYLL